MSAEQQAYFNQDFGTNTMEDAITKSGIQAVLTEGVYRPDMAEKSRMQRIQVELAIAGVPTSLSFVYQRGRSEPLSYALRRQETENLPPAARIDDYR